MLVGAYWSSRAESREEAARRLEQFFDEIARVDGELTSWYHLGWSKATARTPLRTDAASLAAALRTNRSDTDGAVIPDLGFTLGAWNGHEASISATLGTCSKWVGNVVALSWKVMPSRLTRDQWRAIVEASIRAFDPERAVVTNHEHTKRVNAAHPADAGWFTYSRGEPLTEHPFGPSTG